MKKKGKKMRYNIYYAQYSYLISDYVDYIKVVFTNDIYHELGKMICTSSQKPLGLCYHKPKASEKECSRIWKNIGFEQVSPNLWQRCGMIEK